MTPKFRAWDKLTNKMFSVGIIDYSIQSVYIEEPNGLYVERDFDEVELMQPTGLKDVHGKEIFKDDIVKYKFSDHYGYVTDIVCYDYERACFGLMDDTGDYLYSFDWVLSKGTLKGIEVIGNIWENKDLLGE